LKKQIKLKNLLKENKKNLNEGIIADFITNIIYAMMSGKRKELDNLIDPEGRKNIANAAQKLKNAIEKYNKLLLRSDVKKFIEDSGKSVDDFHIDKM